MADLEGQSMPATFSSSDRLPRVNPSAARFPFCLVWTPLPVMAWLAPFVGHLGICTEEGVILDFAGAYFVNVDGFAFGATSRYLQLKPEKCCFPLHLSNHVCKDSETHNEKGSAKSWDDALKLVMRHFQHVTYNIFTSNCHSFVARCLNTLAYKGYSNWNMVDLVVMIFLEGKWVKTSSFLYATVPWLVIMTLGIYMVGWSFVLCWAFFVFLLTSWFLVGSYYLKGVLYS